MNNDITVKLAIIRSKLANQRTYLSYIRTGLSIAAIAGIFKKYKILYFGLFMTITSGYQYYVINKSLDTKIILENNFLDLIPLIYIVLSFIVFYLQFHKK
jgi:uncharacterized membrane protein YidH (DUF202 family)